MKIPTYLKHKPVLEVANYDQLDGPYRTKTDAKGLSVGLAQWIEPGCTEISAKVWRNTGEKWSRQSEELPMHRVLDLAILTCRSYLYFQNAYRYPKLYDPDNPQIDRVGLQGDAMTIEVCKDNPMIDEDIQLFSQALSQDGEIIGERLSVLSQLLKEAGY